MTQSRLADYPAGVRDGAQSTGTAARARCLDPGNRTEGDNAVYPDEDLIACEREEVACAAC